MRVLFFLMLITYFNKSVGQTFTLGPKVGINFSSLNFNQKMQIADTTFQFITKDAKIGLMGGLFFRIKAKNVYFQPEFMFNQERTSFHVLNNFDTLVGEVKELEINKIDVPIMIGYKAGKSFRMNVGIVGSYILYNGVSNFSQTIRYATKISTSDLSWAWQAGIGFDIRKRCTLDFKYEGNLGTQMNTIISSNQTTHFVQRKNNFQITLGIALIPFKQL